MTYDSSGNQRLLEAVVIRPVGVDELAIARRLLSAGFRAFSSADHSEEEAAAIQTMLDSPDIVDELRGRSLFIAWLDQTPVAVGGWRLADDSGRAARLTAIAVDPMYGYLGLGRLIVAYVEQNARKAGFKDLVVHAHVATKGFFVRLGYDTTAQSVRTVGTVSRMRVTYMRKPLGLPEGTVDDTGRAGLVSPDQRLAAAHVATTSATTANVARKQRSRQVASSDPDLRLIDFVARPMLSKASH